MPETPNIYVSNGTCWYNDGYKADSSMIPCGNDYFAHAACCQANDTCLESNACYNSEYGVTYIAGCTDQFYNSSVCPNKYEDLNDPTWMGMAYCNGTSNEWLLCNQPDDPSTIESPAPCSCPTKTSDRTMTMSAASSIVATAYLPSAVKLEINYIAGHYPTTTVASEGSSSSVPTSTALGPATSANSSASSSTQPASTSPSSSTSQGLSTNAIIGIAVGASVGGVFLLIGLIYSLRLFLRRRQDQQQGDDENADGGNDKITAGSPNGELDAMDAQDPNTGTEQPSHLAGARTSTISELDGRSSRPWSTRSEVDGTGIGTGSSIASPTRMQSISEQGHGQVQPSELAAIPLVELEA